MSGLVAGLLPLLAALGLIAWGAVVLAARRWPAGAARGPATRLRVARLWLYAPLWIPGLLLTAVLARGLLPGDHCLAHVASAHHHHLCLVHLPTSPERALPWALALGVIALAAGRMLAAIRRGRRDARRLRALVALSRPSPYGADVRLLDTAEPIALAVGGLRRSILVSRGLIEGVSPTSLRAILAHERAHVARRDTLLGAVDHVVAALLPRAVAADLVARITLAREQACDAAAAHAVADPLRVARALTEVLRLKLRALPGAASFDGGIIEARIAWLLDPPTIPPLRRWLGPGIVALLILFGAGPLHDSAEHLLVLLLH